MKTDMDLNKILFRPVRGGLDEALREVVAFDYIYQFFNYMRDKFKVVPILSFYGFDERISWNTFIVLDDVSRLPLGYIHIPYDKIGEWCN